MEDITYTELKNANDEIICIMSSTGWAIPVDPANSDYAAYLAWAIAEGIIEAPVVEPEVTEPTKK